MKTLMNSMTLLTLGLGLTACASGSYQMTSEPAGASVFYFDPSTQKRMLVGVTPLTYKKSTIPSDKPFLMSVEMEGYETQETPVAPNDGSKTFMHFKMKPNPKGLKKSDLEINQIVNALFKSQMLIYQKKYQAAVLELDSLLKDRPNLVQALVMKGTAFYMLQDLNSAVEVWKKALALDRNNEQLLKFLEEKNIKL